MRMKPPAKAWCVERDAACVSASIRNFGFVTATGRAQAIPGGAPATPATCANIAPQAGIQVVHQGLNVVATRDKAVDVLGAFMATDMAQSVGCELWSLEQAARHAPELKLGNARAVLHSPIDLRVESRQAIGQLTRWLAEQHNVSFRFGEAVLEVATPKVVTAKATLHAERVVSAPMPIFMACTASCLPSTRYACANCRCCASSRRRGSS